MQSDPVFPDPLPEDTEIVEAPEELPCSENESESESVPPVREKD